MQLTTGFVLSALIALSYTSPVERTSNVKTISLSRRSSFVDDAGIVDARGMQSHISSRMAKFNQGFAVYEQNTGKPHPFAADKDLQKRGIDWKHRVPLSDDRGLLWHGAVVIGTPGKMFNVDFDTGSSDVWVPGTLCKESCDGHERYDPSASSSSRNLEKRFVMAYGDGSTVYGGQYQERVKPYYSYISSGTQTIGVAEHFSSGFAKSNFAPDGLLGLGFQSISSFNAAPFFQNIADQAQVEQPVFTFRLDSPNAELRFGSVDQDAYQGEITYTPVVHKAYWEVILQSVSVNGEPAVSNVHAIIDTGTTLIIGPKRDVDKFYAAVPGAQDASHAYGPGAYTVPCNGTADISLTFGGKAFPLPTSRFAHAYGSDEDMGVCLGAIVAAEGAAWWTIGDAFLQGVYSVFDMSENARVGFAPIRTSSA